MVFLEKVIEEGNKVLDKTPEMLAVLKQAGVVDAGGKGYMCVLAGAYNGVTNREEISLESFKSEAKPVKHSMEHEIDPSDIKFGYCTEFMIDTSYDPDMFREELLDDGDSMLVVGGESLIKVHIHTNNPGMVLEKALAHGPLKDIKIDNMRYQHQHLIHEKEEIEKLEDLELKKYGFIAVSVGDGIESLFKELNVDVVIAGGQTMNPSTEDILKAIDKVKAEEIIILPNNGNIILAASGKRLK